MEQAKRAAARRAVDFVCPGMLVGLGSGTTALAVVRELGERAAGLRLRGCVASSRETELAARREGLRVLGSWRGPLDVCIDGADEVELTGSVIKGGGGRLLRERVVAEASLRFVVVAEERKVSSRLGERWGYVPVAALRFGLGETARRLEGVFGSAPRVRGRDGGGRFVSEDGACVLDCPTGVIGDPEGLDAMIRSIPGVLASGLFVGYSPVFVLGGEGGGVRVVETGGAVGG